MRSLLLASQRFSLLLEGLWTSKGQPRVDFWAQGLGVERQQLPTGTQLSPLPLHLIYFCILQAEYRGLEMSNHTQSCALSLSYGHVKFGLRR